MTVSSSPRGRGSIRRIPIPDVLGLNVDNAKIVLSNAGFSRFKLHFTEDYADEFDVVDQYPRSGLLVHADTEVQLNVARTSVVAYLPQVFQQAALDGASWLKGFLFIVQSLHDKVNRRLEHIHELFDPRTADEEFLPWLASWLAIMLNPDWSELERRKMLMAATKLFPVRGTATAIRDFVHIYVGVNVVIEENAWPFEGFRIGVNSTVGEDTVILPAMNLAHCFVVRLDKPASQTPDDEIIKIHQIIQNQKPAHCSYFLAFSDEAESGVMGAFMAIGVPAGDGEVAMGIGIGMDGMPIDVIGGGEASSGLLYEPEPEPDSDKVEKTPMAAGKKAPKATARSPKASAKGTTKKTGKASASKRASMTSAKKSSGTRKRTTKKTSKKKE